MLYWRHTILLTLVTHLDFMDPEWEICWYQIHSLDPHLSLSLVCTLSLSFSQIVAYSVLSTLLIASQIRHWLL